MGGNWRRGLGGGILALAVLAAAAPAAAREPDLAHMSGGAVTAFGRAFPKGGELHNHISGAIFGETVLQWAAEDGLCVDVTRLALVPPCQPSDTLKPVAAAVRDEVMRSALVDSFSTRHPGFLDRSGHDQFFGVFSRIGALPDSRAADQMAVVLDGLGRQNTFYLEAMITPNGGAAAAIGAQAGWKGGDFQGQAAANSAKGSRRSCPPPSPRLTRGRRAPARS
ncbi:hypothetical protein [Phenylobacterium aquaticum]|uniref:hypothetical protein n=1 Tax=Phenylobacterium aquaticum TaxID=1763816 RepID=UPI001F5DEE5F|nr:hypothetical protein [Phenylobacterium aquaticum]MCI3131342.1 hypothetical protein [Phenylobacterium aquaticum]